MSDPQPKPVIPLKPVNHPDDAEQRAIVDGLFRMVSSDDGGPLRMLNALQSPPPAVRTQVGRLLLLLGGIAVPDRATWMAMLDQERNQVHALEEMCRRAEASEPPSAAELQVIEAREVALNAIAAKHNLVSVWSVNDADDLDAGHPFPPATTVVHETISGDAGNGMRVWGGHGGRFAVPIPGPRWLDLWIAADQAIQQSGDMHHRFVEYFQVGDDPAELRLRTGS